MPSRKRAVPSTRPASNATSASGTRTRQRLPDSIHFDSCTSQPDGRRRNFSQGGQQMTRRDPNNRNPHLVAACIAAALGSVSLATHAQDAATNDPPLTAREKMLLDRVEQLEKRLSDLESSAVLSEPETRVRKKEVYVDKNGAESDDPVPGSKKVVTYERERVFRR